MDDLALLLFRELHGLSGGPAKRLLGIGAGPSAPADGTEGVRLFSVGDPADDPCSTEPAGAALTVPVAGEGIQQLRALAVSPQWPAVAVAQRLMGALADRCLAEGTTRLIARSPGPDLAGLLGACGFRPVPEDPDVLVLDL